MASLFGTLSSLSFRYSLAVLATVGLPLLLLLPGASFPTNALSNQTLKNRMNAGTLALAARSLTAMLNMCLSHSIAFSIYVLIHVMLYA